MRRTWALLMTLALLLVLVTSSIRAETAGTTAATPLNDLTTLADYLPGDTLAYATIRTDEAYLEDLDAIAQMLNDNLGGEVLPPGISVRDLLDMALIDATGLSLDIALDWLGESAAISLSLPEDLQAVMDNGDFKVIIAAEISDRAAAEDFIRLSTEDNVTETDEGDYTLFTDEETYVTITDDVLLLSNDGDLLAQRLGSVGDGSLSTSDQFAAALAAMPQDDYNAFGYVDLIALNDLIDEFNTLLAESMDAGNPGLGELIVNAGVDTIPASVAAFGLTILDGRSFTADFAVIAPDGGLLQQATLPGMEPAMAEPGEPVDLDFAANLPANAQLVIHSTDFGGQMLGMFESLDRVVHLLQTQLDVLIEAGLIDELLDNMDGMGNMPGMRGMPGMGGMDMDDMMEAGMDNEMVRQLIEGLDLTTVNVGGIIEVALTRAFAGFTGLNLRYDVLEWMTGDYAIYTSLIPVESDLDFTIDMAYVTEVTDADAAAYVVERFTEAVGLYGIGHYTEEIGAGQAIVLTQPVRGLVAVFVGMDALDILNDTPELDFIIGADDAVFVVSGRPGAEYALTGEGDSLLDDEAFTYAAENLFLEDTVSVLYIGTESLVDVMPELDPDLFGADALAAIAALVNSLESATITTTFDDTEALLRFTLTIQDEPLISMEEMGMMDMDMDDSQMQPTPIPTPTDQPETSTDTTMVMDSRYAEVIQSQSGDGFWQIGSPNAPVVVEVFGSYGCPHCATFEENYNTDLIAFAKTGDVVVRYIPMVTGDPMGADLGAKATFCAADSGAYWQMHDIVFELQRQGNLTRRALLNSSTALEINTNVLNDCIRSAAAAEHLEAGLATAAERGVTGTPTIFINGEQTSQPDMLAAIDAALAVMGTPSATPTP